MAMAMHLGHNQQTVLDPKTLSLRRLVCRISFLRLALGTWLNVQCTHREPIFRAPGLPFTSMSISNNMGLLYGTVLYSVTQQSRIHRSVSGQALDKPKKAGRWEA